MIRKGEWYLIRAMKKDGASISGIAKRYGIDRKTVRKLLKADNWPEDEGRSRVVRTSKLDPFKNYIKARLEKVDLSAVRIYDEIVPQGYTGRMTILRSFIRELVKEERLLAVVRFETLPGEQSQVDWAHLGRFNFGGVSRAVYAFVMVLGYSRMRFVTFTHSMDIHTLMRCHIEAFRYFGGHTREILYDNMKTVILKPKGPDSPAVVNPEFVDFAGFYGFTVDSCRPYRAQTKGKVERLVGYVRGNFLAGREFVSLDDMKHQGLMWCDKVNSRIHGTTGRIPLEDLAKECLLPLGAKEYDTARRTVRLVSRDCLVSYGGNRYEVSWKYAQKAVVVKDYDDGRILICCDDESVAEYEKAQGRSLTLRVPGLNSELWEKVLSSKGKQAKKEQAAGDASSLSLVGGQVPLVPVESRDLSYYEEAAL